MDKAEGFQEVMMLTLIIISQCHTPGLVKADPQPDGHSSLSALPPHHLCAYSTLKEQ